MFAKLRDGVHLVRWSLIGLGILGLVFAFFAHELLPITARVWPPSWLMIIFSIFPILLILLGVNLRVGHPTSRSMVIYGLWILYVLGLIGGVAFFLFTALAAAIMDLTLEPDFDPLFVREKAVLLSLALLYVVGMPLFNMSIVRDLSEDEVVERFKRGW